MSDLEAIGRAHQTRMDAIQRLLGKALRAARKAQGRTVQAEDQVRVQEAMLQVGNICGAYREGLFELAHSVRVKRIASDLESLVSMLRAFGDRELTPADQERVRARIKTWCPEARQWVALLPMHSGAQQLQAQAGWSREIRLARLKECWLEAGGADFAPPPQKAIVLPVGVPDHFRRSDPDPTHRWGPDPIDAVDGGGGAAAWVCRTASVLELLEFAKEALLLEVGGSDKGGRTTFAERRRKCSLRDAFALSCVVTFERTIGPKTARQSQTYRRTTCPTLFEEFLEKVQQAAVGGDVPKLWALGPDPVRRAIKVQRAWQSLFKAAGVTGGQAFSALPEEARQAALRRLKPQTRNRLTPTARPWV